MLQTGELIDLVISAILTVYIASLSISGRRFIKTYWFFGISLILFSKFLSVAETFFLPVMLNLVEHLSNLIAAILISISIYIKEI